MPGRSELLSCHMNFEVKYVNEDFVSTNVLSTKCPCNQYHLERNVDLTKQWTQQGLQHQCHRCGCHRSQGGTDSELSGRAESSRWFHCGFKWHQSCHCTRNSPLQSIANHRRDNISFTSSSERKVEREKGNLRWRVEWPRVERERTGHCIQKLWH